MSAPQDNINFISHGFMLWTIPYINSLRKKTPEPEDLITLPQFLDLELQYQELKQNWAKQLRQDQPKFYQALLNTFLMRFLRKTISDIPQFISFVCLPVTFYYLMDYFQSDEWETWQGVLLAILVFLLSIYPFSISLANLCDKFNLSSNVRLTGQLLLFDVIIELDSNEIGSGHLTGKMINVAASDLELFEFVAYTPEWVLTLGYNICVIFVSYWLLEETAYIYLVVSVITLVLGYSLAQIPKIIRSTIGQITDNRVKLLTNIIDGIKLVKLYGWDKGLLNLILKMRKQETRKLAIRYFPRITFLSIMMAGLGLTTMLITLAHLEFGKEMSLSNSVYIVMSVSIMLVNNFGTFSTSLDFLMQIYVNSKRIGQTLQSKTQIAHLQKLNNLIGIKFVNASFSYEQTQDNSQSLHPLLTADDSLCLKNIDFKAEAGEFIAVIGDIGSGKSSMLLSILNELNLISGTAKASGKTAYVEPEPVIFSDSIQNNILFGKEMDLDRYKDVIRVSCLLEDLQKFANGDQEIVGDKGITLSGGQKARIAIARAVYANYDIVLMDDPVSALDTKVAKYIIKYCIKGYLKDKLRILATHRLDVLKYCDRIIALDQGSIVFQGNYESLREDTALLKYLSEQKKGEKIEIDRDFLKQNTQVQQIEEDALKGGATIRTHYRFWIEFFQNSYLLALFFIVGLGVQGIYVYQTFWYNYWSNQSKEEQKDSFYIEVMAILSVSAIIAMILRFQLNIVALLHSSKNLHNKALKSLMETYVSFFDITPIGRIINRLSRDVYLIDEILVMFYPDFVQFAFYIIGFIAFVIYTNWYLIAIVGLFAYGLYLMVKFSLSTSRQLRKIELTTKSPLFSHLNNAMMGLRTIRVYQTQDYFKQKFLRDAIINQKAFYNYQIVSYFLRCSIIIIASLLIFACILVLVFMKEELDVVLISTTLSFTGVILTSSTWISKSIVEIENLMPCCQRLYEYVDLPKEKFENQQQLIVNKGKIELQSVYMKYRQDLSHSLKNISFTIQPGIKCGIVGRTGAGKSSIVQVLFAISPHNKGTLLIDGVDIKQVSVRELRLQLSVIPQDPFLFTTTIRNNLDPLGNFDTDQILQALKIAQLDQLVNQANLDEEIFNLGLSLGQKQLICLARAVLKSSKVLVMDEATSNVDWKTDNIIQKCIWNYFNECTVLTIAHRLDTIKNYDQIIVMDKGRVIEEGKYQELLENQNSEFFKLHQF